MTKTPIDYSRTIIYKLCCKDPNIKDIYVGSTTDFRIRKNSHKTCCNNPNSKKYNRLVYQFIRENGGWQNWDMIMIKKYTKCKSKLQCLKKERKYIEKLNATLNSDIPGRTTKEYYKDNKDKVLKHKVKYYQKNKEKIKENRKREYEKNKQYKNEKIKCVCGSITGRSNMSNHKKTKKHLKFIEQNQ